MFDGLCQLAHFASFNNQSQRRVNFSLIELQNANIPTPQDTLGLMKASQKLTCHGRYPQYSFLHSIVQDFLCAVWISRMDEDKQENYVSLLLNSDPMSPGLQFFAGRTQLKGNSHKTLKLLLKEANKPTPAYFPVSQLAMNPCKSADPRRVQLAVLHCIYESHQEEAFLQVIPIMDDQTKSLMDMIAPAFQVIPTQVPINHHCLCFDCYHLSTFNCTVIGKYLSHVLTHSRCPIMLKMEQCKMGDRELSHLLQPILVKMSSRDPSTCHTFSNALVFDLRHSNITHKSVEHLKSLATSEHTFGLELLLGNNFFKASTNRYVALKHLIKCLQ